MTEEEDWEKYGTSYDSPLEENQRQVIDTLAKLIERDMRKFEWVQKFKGLMNDWRPPNKEYSKLDEDIKIKRFHEWTKSQLKKWIKIQEWETKLKEIVDEEV